MLSQNVSSKILTHCKAQNYPIQDFNIIYVEGMGVDGVVNTDDANQFNDVRCIFNKERCIDVWGATTEPGAWYTDRPLNPLGAFRIAFGYHHAAWQVGIHGESDPHEALIQCMPVKGYRDYNRDAMRKGDYLDEGNFGINQHWGYDYSPDNIGRASAGCLVGRTRTGHRQFMEYCKNSKLNVFSTIVLPGDKIFVK